MTFPTRLPTDPPPSGKQGLSYEAFLAWAGEDVRAEWVRGEVVILSPASDRHQAIVELLFTVLKLLVERDGLGWARIAPFQMRLPTIPSGREPDILFVREERRHLVQGTHLDGPADLVIEVTSPESFSRDRGEKFLEYEAAGIAEYWLVDPDRKQIEVYRLGANGRYVLTAPDGDGTLHSAVVAGFWVRPEWLWQEPVPRALDVARAIGVL